LKKEFVRLLKFLLLARIKKHERIKAGFFYIYFIRGNSKNNKKYVKNIKKVTFILAIKIISLPSKYMGIYFEKQNKLAKFH